MDFHNTLMRYRAIHVEFFGPTNTKGARIRIKDMRQGTTKWLPYNYEIGDIVNQAGDRPERVGPARHHERIHVGHP